jgi:membrane protease subunit HflK
MAWNEPGGNQRDPWQGGGPRRGQNQGPDLDAAMKKLGDRMGKVFGGPGGSGVWVLVIGILAAWFALDSWRTIDEAERGVVLRFGEYNRTMGPGLNLKWPGPIEQVFVVEATRVRSTSDQVRMLTRDENIITVDFNVQYIVADPRAFLFTLRDPDRTIREAAESAVRQVIGSSAMNDILAGRITELSTNARTVLQQLLDDYSRERQKPGEGEVLRSFFQVNEVNFQNVRPPPEVKEAFDDAIAAREDKQRVEDEARAYASKVVPEARGEAARIRAEAEGARESAVVLATGAATRFTLLAEQYRKAPEVTRRRLMLETMQEVLTGTPKIVVDNSRENVLYLPLDRLGSGQTILPPLAPSSSAPASAAPGATVPAIETIRGRDTGRPVREGR